MDDFALAPPIPEPLDFTSVQTPPFVSPGRPQPPKPQQDRQQMMKLAIMLPLAMRGGPGAVQGLLQGFLQSGQQKQQMDRQTQIDQRTQEQHDWQRQYQQGQLDNQRLQQRQKFVGDFTGGLEGLETPEAIDAYLKLQSQIGQPYGITPDQLSGLAAPYREPSRLQKRAAQRYLSALEKQHGAKWMETAAQFTHEVGGQRLTLDQVLAQAGQARDPNAPKAAPQSGILPDVPLDRQHAMALASGNEQLAKTIEQAMSRQDATRRDPPRQPIQVTVGNSGLTRDQVGAAAGLRDDFRAESKDFYAARDGYERMLASAQDPSPAGDVALLYGFMKLLDPNSVVRETEFATAARTGSLPQQIQAAAERVINGQRLTKEQRADFMNRAKGLFGRAQNRQTQRSDKYKKIATRTGVPEDLVIVDDAPVDEGGAPAAPAAAGSKTPQRIGRFEVVVE